MDQACIDTTMSDQEYQMPKKIDDVVQESPGDAVTGHHAMLEDVPLLSSSCLASLVLMLRSYGLVPCARGVLSVGSIRDCPRRYHAKSGSSSIVEISIPTASFRSKSLETLDGLSKSRRPFQASWHPSTSLDLTPWVLWRPSLWWEGTRLKS